MGDGGSSAFARVENPTARLDLGLMEYDFVDGGDELDFSAAYDDGTAFDIQSYDPAIDCTTTYLMSTERYPQTWPVLGTYSISGAGLQFAPVSAGASFSAGGVADNQRIADGEAVSFIGQGGDLGDFGGKFDAPGTVSMTWPTAFTDGGTPTSPDGGLTVTWTGGTCADRVLVSIGWGGTDTYRTVTCGAPALAGSLTFDPSVTAEFSNWRVQAFSYRQAQFTQNGTLVVGAV